MNKYISVAALVSLINLPVQAVQEEVYSWTDENGVVHYADQPRTADAKRFILRNNNYSKPFVTAAELELHNKVLAKYSASTSGQSDDALNSDSDDSADEQAEPSLGSFPKKSCDYLREQISRADAYVTSSDAERAEQAKRQVQIAEKMLRDGQCN